MKTSLSANFLEEVLEALKENSGGGEDTRLVLQEQIFMLCFQHNFSDAEKLWRMIDQPKSGSAYMGD